MNMVFLIFFVSLCCGYNFPISKFYSINPDTNYKGVLQVDRITQSQECLERERYQVTFSVQLGSENILRMLAICLRLSFSPGTIVHWTSDLLPPMESTTHDDSCDSFFTYGSLKRENCTDSGGCRRDCTQITPITITDSGIGTGSSDLCSQGTYCIPDYSKTYSQNISMVIAVFSISKTQQSVPPCVSGSIMTILQIAESRPDKPVPVESFQFDNVCIGSGCNKTPTTTPSSSMPPPTTTIEPSVTYEPGKFSASISSVLVVFPIVYIIAILIVIM